MATRLGAGEAPPKSPDDYAPTLPEGMSLETLKADPLYTGFLKGAHARGINNAQLSYVLEGYAQRLAMANSPEVAEADLRKTFATDDQLGQALHRSYKATAAYAGDDETRAKLESKFGNDPDFIRLMARIGAELGEDPGVQGITSAEQESLESLIAHPSYLDAKHPEHAKTVAKARALYAKKHGA